MNCAEFQRILPDVADEARNAEQEAHVRSCSACSLLIADLHFIAQQARSLLGSEEPSPRVWNSIATALQELRSDLDKISEAAARLQASEEPSPRVWNSIEIALRQEGLIRQPQWEDPLAVRRVGWWNPAWLVPVAATLLVAVGLMVYQPGRRVNPAQNSSPASAFVGNLPTVMSGPGIDDDLQVLEAVAARTPALRGAYEDNLRSVNAYIHDAEQSVRDDPNDEEAQQYLMAAYEQKAMVYEMALNPSLP